MIAIKKAKQVWRWRLLAIFALFFWSCVFASPSLYAAQNKPKADANIEEIEKYKSKGSIYELPVLMEDDTNSDGLQQVKYATTVDTRRTITYGANYITKTISVGQRFMIKNKDVKRTEFDKSPERDK